MESLERLQGLHRDLVAFSETKLASIERLWQELEASIEDFQKLLHKAPKDRKSRALVATGEIEFRDEEFRTNEAFQQSALQIAEALDLDELESARLLLEFQPDQPVPGQSTLLAIVSGFHERRESLLQCLRLVLQESEEHEEDDGEQDRLREFVQRIINKNNAPASDASAYIQKCIQEMHEIERWQFSLHEQAQKISVLGALQGADTLSIIQLQRSSLLNQHEAFGACLYYLFRARRSSVADLRKLLDVPQRFERIDMGLLHYLPAFSAAFVHHGSCDQGVSQEDAQSLHKMMDSGQTKSSSGQLQPFQAVLKLWWVCVYGSWHREGMITSAQRVSDPEADQKAKMVTTSLQDGALTLLLSICAKMTDDEWHHPARQELVTLMLSNGQHTTIDGELPAAFFQTIFMECLETFSEAWISNLPDSIRELKNDEDDRRLRHITAMQDNMDPGLQQNADVSLHLECFLVLISFAFEGRPDNAQGFWTDPDSNLSGFLHWTSKRQTVPRVSAFCEMLASITQGPTCALSGHRFLLDKSSQSARTRRSPSMNYEQIFEELAFYARRVNEKASQAQNAVTLRKVLPTDMNELESPVMLSCYLRLLTHMSGQSAEARSYLLKESHIIPHALQLCSGPVPSYLKASVFTALESCMTEKTTEFGSSLWEALDLWASQGPASLAEDGHKRPSPSASSRLYTFRQTLDAIALSFDQYSAFTALLRTLIAPAVDQNFGDRLPFPEFFGGDWRPTLGIDSYVDFVCGALFAKRSHDLPDETPVRVFRFNCLDFMAIVLETFNENLVTAASQARPSGKLDASVESYIQRHPFARVMEWLFNEDVSRGLLITLSLSMEKLESLPPDSLEIFGVERCLDVLNLVSDLQPTYLEVVKPLVRKSNRSSPVGPSVIMTIEDIVSTHPQVVSALGLFTASSHDRIVLKSLDLLQKLSCSTRFNVPLVLTNGKGNSSRRIVDLIGSDGSVDSVSVALGMKLIIDIRELESGSDCPGYLIKDGILAFLNTCLASQDDRPNVAHLFLGFSRVGDSLIIKDESSLETGLSLCHSVIGLAEAYPDGENGSFASWLMHIKTSALHVLRQLWTSPLTSSILISELRKIRFFPSQIMKQSLLTTDTRWDGLTVHDNGFWYGTPAQTLVAFLEYRNFLFDYAVTEMRALAHSKSTYFQTQMLSTLQGTSPNPVHGTKTAHMSVLDMFDFAHIDIGPKFGFPQPVTFEPPDLRSCMSASDDGSSVLYDLKSLDEVLRSATNQRPQTKEKGASVQPDQVAEEVQMLLQVARAMNNWTLACLARRQALRMWVELVIVTIQSWPGDQGSQVQFAVTIMQLINPKLDFYLIGEVEEAAELLRLEDVIVTSLAKIPPSSVHGRASSVIMDRQLHLFRTCISNIPAPTSSPTLRAYYYSICASYIGQLNDSMDASLTARRRCLECVKSTGTQLVSVLSDDAENGQESCRLPALVLLTLLTDLDRQEKSAFVIESLAKINMLQVIADSIKDIAFDIEESEAKERVFVLSLIQARLALLLAISRTRGGAGSLLDAGLLQAVRDSRVFSADPDLGFDTANPAALKTYYELIASMLRLLVSVFLSRGDQNQQSQHQMRQFLAENRSNMVGAFKRYQGVGGRDLPDAQNLLRGVVKSYTAMVSMADFVEFEEPEPFSRTYTNGFT